MIYRRSGTTMDYVSDFFPQSFMHMAGLRGAPVNESLAFGGDAPELARRFSRLGQTEGEYEYEGYAPNAPALTPTESWNWQQSIGDALKSAPAVLRDLYVAKETGDYQAKLLEVNLERARQNKPPLNPDQYSPRVNLAVAPATVQAAQKAGIAALIAATGLGLIFVLGKRARRR